MNEIIPKVIDKYNLSKWQIRDLISNIIVIIHYNHTVKDSNVEFGSHETKMSEKQKAIGQSAPSGHQGVHQSGDLVKDHA